MFSNYVSWPMISRHQRLSESFIEEFSDKVDWQEITVEQYLTEKFMRKFQNKILWKYVKHEQNGRSLPLKQNMESEDYTLLSHRRSPLRKQGDAPQNLPLW